MLPVVFSVICIFSAVWSVLTGTGAETAAAVLDGAGRAVEVTLALLGVMGLWSGVMAVFSEIGAIKKLAGLMKPITRLIFREPCEEAVACLAANLLGVGNAATPLGISALKKMQGGKSVITDDGIMLTVLCCSGVSIVPTTVLALRGAAGAGIMFELLPIIWGVGSVGALISIILTKLLCKVFRHRGGRT